ncbi:TPA: hypothetical protein ACWV6C_005304 [Salmonella enterica subsp. enterica serovar Muenchen]
MNTALLTWQLTWFLGFDDLRGWRFNFEKIVNRQTVKINEVERGE